MATKKSRKSKPPQDLEALKSDVVSFASSIGLPAAPSSSVSGFDDSDFRKNGPLKPLHLTKTNQNPSRNLSQKQDNKRTKLKNNLHEKKPESKPKPKPRAGTESSFNSFTDLSNNKNLSNRILDDKFNNLPKLPLVRANTLGTWYVDAAELEEKVLDNEAKKKVVIKDLQEWNALVEKKRELGERLLAQYVRDYESSRGQSGDIKMLIATQRSGTAADKVSAFSVMVGDNAVANIRSLDVLLGKFLFLWPIFEFHLGNVLW